MAFKASVATQAAGLTKAMQTAQWLQMVCSQAAATMQAGTVSSDLVLQLLDNLRQATTAFQGVAAIPGIAAYAQAQFNDATYNIATEFTTMTNALAAALSWITTNFPKDAQGFSQSYTINADGSKTPASFTSAQTAGLVTALNAVAATIS